MKIPGIEAYILRGDTLEKEKRAAADEARDEQRATNNALLSKLLAENIRLRKILVIKTRC